MKGLTVCQPHASAITHGPKRIENRTWFTSYRGPLLIHAGLSGKWIRALAYEDRQFFERFLGPLEKLPLKAALATCDLVDVLQEGAAIKRYPDQRPFIMGPCCWVLENVKPFKTPIPWRGAQGLWSVDEQELQNARDRMDRYGF
jgi:hypothetical protein